MIRLHQCAYCRHFNGENLTAETCTAFPDGIPQAIYKNAHFHDEPYPGDNGTQFEPFDETDRRMFTKLKMSVVSANLQKRVLESKN